MPAGPPGFIEGVLKEAERLAVLSSSGFRDRVQQRLAKGAREYGPDGYLGRPLAELLEEIAEEGQDLAGWSALALDATSADDSLEAADLRFTLLEIASLGARAEVLARQAVELTYPDRRFGAPGGTEGPSHG